MTALAVFGGCLLVAGSIIAHALLRGRSTTDPAPEPTPEPPTFDEHSAAAMALLTPDHPGLPDEDVAHIAATLPEVIDRYAFYLIAREQGLDDDVCRRLIERTYDVFRERLTPPQMARALLIGVLPHARERAAHLTDTDRLSIADLES